MRKKITFLIPCMNEDKNIPILYDRINKELSNVYDIIVIFIDDGSTDNTLNVIKQLSSENINIKYLSFSRNFGHQLALRAGYDYANGDAVICMDADLQHPISIIHEMINKWNDGYDIVYTKRIDTLNSFFKRKSSDLFYRTYNMFSKVKLQYGTADFRLIDIKVLNVFKQFRENTPFIRGIVSWMGFKQGEVIYNVDERIHGKTKYSLSKMISFSLHGFTSFSIFPLRISSIIGFILSLLSFIYAIYAIFTHLFTNNTVTGWTSLIVCFLFLSGLQFMMIGIIGEYLGKVFIEVKQRPLYIIAESNVNLS